MPFFSQFILCINSAIPEYIFAVDLNNNRGVFINKSKIDDFKRKEVLGGSTNLKGEAIMEISENESFLNIKNSTVFLSKNLSLEILLYNYPKNYFVNHYLYYGNTIVKCLENKNNFLKQVVIQYYSCQVKFNKSDDNYMSIKKKNIKSYSFRQDEDKTFHHLSYKTNRELPKSNSNNLFDTLLNIIVMMCFCWDCYQCFSTPNEQINEAFQGRDNIFIS
jgi:hypothetical protein